MKTVSLILLIFLAVGCSKESPVEAPPPDLTGHWLSSIHGYNLNVLLAQNNQTVTGSGLLVIDSPYSNNPVSISGVFVQSVVSLSIESADGSLMNFSGKLLNDSTLFGDIRGYILPPLPITLNRQIN